MSEVFLHDYWRSSASYRVRIALNLGHITYTSLPVDLLKKEHKAPEYLARNPQGLVPTLNIDGQLFAQSLAVIEYLSETRGLAFLPSNLVDRAKVRSIAYAIAMDIHPICNLSVVSHVMALTGGGEAMRDAWMQKFIGEGLTAVEEMLHESPEPLCFGDAVTIADICLVPQVYNALRWGIDMSSFRRINSIVKKLDLNPAFADAHPDRNKL